MDSFGHDFTSPISTKPNFAIYGNQEDELSEELDFKLKIADKKRLPPKNETLDVEEQPRLLRSVSFDSSLPPYDPITNYLSPRPKYLLFNPDRHRKMLVRLESVSRVRKSASFDGGMPFSEEQLESSVDSCLDAPSGDESVSNNEPESRPESEPEHEHEQEEFDEFEEGSGWNLNVFIQYLFVLIVLILTTLTISLINSITTLPAKEAINGFKFSKFGGKSFGPVMVMAGNLSEKGIEYGYNVWDKKYLDVITEELSEDEMEKSEIAENNTTDVNQDEMEEIEFEDIEKHEEISHEIEPGKQAFSQILTENEIEGVKNTDNSIKLVNFDPIFGTFVAVSVVILVTLSVVYYSKIVKSMVLTNMESTSFSQTGFSRSTAYSPSHGSFIVETKIIKKQKSKTPEILVSKVRRSSRIHNRSVTSP